MGVVSCTHKKRIERQKKKETFQNRTAQSIIKPNQIENKKKWEPRRKTPDQDRYGMVFYPLQFFFSNTCQKVNFFLSSIHPFILSLFTKKTESYFLQRKQQHSHAPAPLLDVAYSSSEPRNYSMSHQAQGYITVSCSQEKSQLENSI